MEGTGHIGDLDPHPPSLLSYMNTVINMLKASPAHFLSFFYCFFKKQFIVKVVSL